MWYNIHTDKPINFFTKTYKSWVELPKIVEDIKVSKNPVILMVTWF